MHPATQQEGLSKVEEPEGSLTEREQGKMPDCLQAAVYMLGFCESRGEHSEACTERVSLHVERGACFFRFGRRQLARDAIRRVDGGHFNVKTASAQTQNFMEEERV